MSTVEGLSQTVALALEGRQGVRADQIDTGAKDFLPTRATAARHVAERGLRLLVNLHVKSPEVKELLRGETNSQNTVSAAQQVGQSVRRASLTSE
jgi:hypothetical protein